MEIIPFQSIGLLSFGDSRKMSRDKVGMAFSTFVKDAGNNETDAFDECGLHLYYDDQGRLEFVEAYTPAEVTFCGIRFLGRELSRVIEEMRRIGYEASDADGGIDFAEVGIALTVPSGIVEGIAAHRRGYFD